jgi:hypothetical protein
MNEADEMHEFEAEYARGRRRKSADSLHLSATSLGQNWPSCCPQHCPQPENSKFDESPEPLGGPLTIREVAELIGCSVWTIRQRYLRSGIPFVRLRPHGKLIFYKNQIIHWLLTEQQKGGTIT